MQPIKEAKLMKTDPPTREDLYRRQKLILDTFLSRGAISPAQYEQSLHDLTVKMKL